jgi:hypothetical protein
VDDRPRRENIFVFFIDADNETGDNEGVTNREDNMITDYRVFEDGVGGDWRIPKYMRPEDDDDAAEAADSLAQWAADEIVGHSGFANEDGALPSEVEWSGEYRYQPDATVEVEVEDGESEWRYVYIVAYSDED